jgi:anaerobic magnesium-protoporphyrin IX monomethyl ester cyclase
LRLLFVVPPHIIKNAAGIDAWPTVSVPLGVLYMSAYLREKDWKGEIEVYDARLSAKLTRYPDGSTLFGDTWETVTRSICDFEPHVIGISNMFSWQIDAAIYLSQCCKKACPDAITILGGPHASSFPTDMVKQPTIDYVVMGEGEERLFQLLQALEKGESVSIQGVLGNEDDADLLRPNKKAPIGFINDLDSLPFPAYDLVDVDRYFYLQSRGYSRSIRETGNRAMTILTSRGCPHQCIFCSVQSTMGYRFRFHSPEYVKAHIDFLIQNYAIDYINFEDDNFTHDNVRYDDILDILVGQSPKIPWGTPNGVRADSWSSERIRKTKESGCQYLCIAIESSSQRVIDEVIKKKLDLNQAEFVMRECKKIGLPLMAYYVLGLPGETADEIRANVKFAIDKYESYDVYPSFSIANPIPGTELHDIVVENDLFFGVSANDPPQPNSIKTDEFDPEFIQMMHDQALRKKTWVTFKRMMSSPNTFRFYVEMSIKHPWFFKRTLRSAIRSFLVRR